MALQVLHKQICGADGVVDAATLNAVRGRIDLGTGDNLVDDLLAVGYLYVNSGNVNEACGIFSLIVEHCNAPAAYLGLGSGYALQRKFDEAEKTFTKAIECTDGKLADAWKRRGQTRGAMGKLADALHDLDVAWNVDPTDADCAFQMGLLKHQSKEFKEALQAFEIARSMGISNGRVLNYLGMCNGQIGMAEKSIELHLQAYQADNTLRESVLNAGQMCKELGHWKDALKHFQVCETVDTHPYAPVLSYRGALYYFLGRPHTAARELSKVLNAPPHQSISHAEVLTQIAACFHSLGRFSQCVQYYDAAMKAAASSQEHPEYVQTIHWACFPREVALRQWVRLDSPMDSLDDLTPSNVKEGWCKKEYIGPFPLAEKPVSSIPADVGSHDCQFVRNGRLSASKAAAHRLFDAAKPFNHLVQLKCKGFLPNLRQHAQFGQSVLEMLKCFMATGNCEWRTFFEISVRWRQLSEPADPVWWIDGMPTTSYSEGFGLQTPLVNGQWNTIRYYSYFPMAFDRTKTLLLENATVTFYEGTRLTLVQCSNPSGFEYTIRTPGTPARWEEISKDLQWSLLLAQKTIRDLSASSKDKLRVALDVFYYWVSFAPLSRGTACCGLAALTAILAAGGLEWTNGVPAGKQLDWEAILSQSKDDFLAKVEPWFELRDLKSDILNNSKLREDTETLWGTLRGRLFFLQCVTENEDVPL
eukprot:GSChrysophyteH1.ASY1.ANO1.571.1 assembled CDS